MTPGSLHYPTSDGTGRYLLVGLVILSVLCGLLYLIQFYFMPLWRQKNTVGDALREVRALSHKQKARLFDSLPIYDTVAKHETVSTDNRLLAALALRPLVPVDCDDKPAVCLSDSNCKLLCRNAVIKNYRCDPDRHVCMDGALPVGYDSNRQYRGSNNEDDISESQCDPRIGEYALLQGYNEIGVAQWNCVRLYPGWNNYSQYCEGGKVDFDVRQRPPSY